MKKLEDFKENDVFWTCEPSIESSQYGESLTDPWQGKVNRINLQKRADGSVYGGFCLSHFYKTTEFGHKDGEIDDDSNATAFCNETNVFKTELEAWNYYYSVILTEWEDIKQKTKFAVEKIIELSRAKDEKERT